MTYGNDPRARRARGSSRFYGVLGRFPVSSRTFSDRAAAIRYLDENCAKAIAQGLTRRGIDVTTTPEAGLMGAIDEQQAAYCLS